MTSDSTMFISRTKERKVKNSDCFQEEREKKKRKEGERKKEEEVEGKKLDGEG